MEKKQSIEDLINTTINQRYNLKNGYNDIFFNAKLYEQFIKDLGFEYFIHLGDLMEKYIDCFETLDVKKQEICTEHHIIPVGDPPIWTVVLM